MFLHLCNKCVAQFFRHLTDRDTFCNHHYCAHFSIQETKRRKEAGLLSLFHCFKSFYIAVVYSILDIV